jgi:hypothetical protein
MGDKVHGTVNAETLVVDQHPHSGLDNGDSADSVKSEVIPSIVNMVPFLLHFRIGHASRCFGYVRTGWKRRFGVI